MSDSSSTSNSANGTLVVSNTRRSKVWKHFEPNLVFVDEIPKAVCLYCGLKLTDTHSSGTSSLINHISVACPKIAEEERKKFIGSLKEKQSVLGFVFDPKKSRELLAKFCIHAEVAFRKFEDPYFQKWVESMQPTFNTHGRQTIRNDCFEAYEEMKKQLQGALESLDSRICLTSDMWTSNQKLGYMCVTAHYIDAKFNLNKKIISFKVVKYPHTSLAIAEALSRSLADWGIRRKLFTLTLDNASNNTAAVACFKENQDHGLLRGGRDFHVRCCAHILNILVQDDLLIIRNGIAKIRDLYRHINSSPSRIQAFNGIATTFDLPEKAGLAVDTSNRWDSTFTMLEEALTYRTVLNSYASDSNEVAAPSDEERIAAEGIGAFLKAFAEATKIVSADRKPTTHVFLQVVLCVRRALRNWHWQTSEYVKGMARAMSVKFDKYWKESELNHALIIATILDPTRLEPSCAATHVQLANLYASIDCWSDVARVRKMMKERGLKTNTGCSWIEIGSKVYTFTAENRSKSQVNNVLSVLDCLQSHMEYKYDVMIDVS